MMIQSTPVSFGAVGTPIVIGVNKGLDGQAISQTLQAQGWQWEQFIQLITSEVAIIHGIIGSFMPVLMAIMLTRFFGSNKSWREGLQILPFALFAGVSFTIPYVFTGIVLGPEFPSLIGGLVSLAVVVTAAKNGFLMPKTTWDFPPKASWDKGWLGNLEIKADDITSQKAMHWVTAWVPYLVVALLLVISRVFPTIKEFTTSLTLSFDNILGETGVSASISPLYLPGGLLLIGALVAVIIQSKKVPKGEVLFKAFNDSSKTLLSAGFVLMFTIPMVRLFINSGVNGADIVSMPIAGAQLFANMFGEAFPLISPTIGALGAFIAGSNTVSNMMFSQFQFEAALSLQLSPALIIAAQAVGAAAGNMIAIHNVVAASATVGLMGQEGATLRKTVIPTIYYVAFAGILVWLGVYVFDVGGPLVGTN